MSDTVPDGLHLHEKSVKAGAPPVTVEQMEVFWVFPRTEPFILELHVLVKRFSKCTALDPTAER